MFIFNKVTPLKCILICLLLSLVKPSNLKAQNNSDAQESITYTSDYGSFIPITIQSFKGLPRYGNLSYGVYVNVPKQNESYENLVKLKFMDNILADLDKNNLSKQNKTNNQTTQKTKNSIYIQRLLLHLGSSISSPSVYKKYFCKENDTDNCNQISSLDNRNTAYTWGGDSKNEFQERRSYTGFVKAHLDELISWSNTFYENGEETAYYVAKAKVMGKYDFRAKGFWIFTFPANTGSFMLNSNNFNSKTTKEDKVIKSDEIQLLLSMPPDKAKESEIRDGSALFVVYKVKIKPKMANDQNINFVFELISQQIEFFKDNTLKAKVGEITIDKLIIK